MEHFVELSGDGLFGFDDVVGAEAGGFEAGGGVGGSRDDVDAGSELAGGGDGAEDGLFVGDGQGEDGGFGDAGLFERLRVGDVALDGGPAEFALGGDGLGVLIDDAVADAVAVRRSRGNGSRLPAKPQ